MFRTYFFFAGAFLAGAFLAGAFFAGAFFAAIINLIHQPPFHKFH